GRAQTVRSQLISLPNLAAKSSSQVQPGAAARSQQAAKERSLETQPRAVAKERSLETQPRVKVTSLFLSGFHPTRSARH
ncbi:hypothetical protein QJQ45_028589, partial [Haematococcus lacustris]